MPLLITAQDAEPGMRLAEPLRFRDREIMPIGKVLTARDVTMLQRSYARQPMRIGDAMLDMLVDFEDDAPERDLQESVFDTVTVTINAVRELFLPPDDLSAVDFDALGTAAESIVDQAWAVQPRWILPAPTPEPHRYFVEHASSVVHHALTLALHPEEGVSPPSRDDLVHLVLAGLLCDLGMLPLQSLVRQPEPLHDEAWSAIRGHADASINMFPSGIPDAVRHIVRHHHENVDGSGYPDGAAAARIPLGARVIRVVDSFHAAISAHAYRPAKTVVRAVWELAEATPRGWYDPDLCARFGRLVQPFPIGSRVTLEDGRAAVVCSYNTGRPFAPLVIVAYDEAGHRLSDDCLDGPIALDETSGLRLGHADGERLTYLYEPEWYELEATP